MTSPVIDWLVAWAGEALSGAQVGQDGMTAFRRLRGRAWEPKIAEFGEQVLARRPRALEQAALEPRWDKATYLGTQWGTAEHWVADEDGVVSRVGAIRRVSEGERWSLAKVLGATGVPDEPGRRQNPNVPVPAPGVVPHPEGGDEEPARQTRAFWITKQDLVRHGYTQHCLRCDAMRAGKQTGNAQSAACRARFKQIFEQLGDGRLERALARQQRAVEGPAAAEEQPGEVLGPVAAKPEQDDHRMDEHPELPDMDLGRVEKRVKEAARECRWAEVTKGEVTDFLAKGAGPEVVCRERHERGEDQGSVERVVQSTSREWCPRVSASASGSCRRHQLRPHPGPEHRRKVGLPQGK